MGHGRAWGRAPLGSRTMRSARGRAGSSRSSRRGCQAGVVQVDRRHGRQQRAIDPVVDEGLGRQAAGVRGQAVGPGIARRSLAIRWRRASAPVRRATTTSADVTDEEPPQATVRAPIALGLITRLVELAGGRRLAGDEEVAARGR